MSLALALPLLARASDLPLDGSYRGPVCVDPLPPRPERLATVDGAAWAARLADEDLPGFLIPVKYAEDGRIPPGGRWFDDAGNGYPFARVEHLLAAYEPSASHYRRYRELKGEITEARTTLAPEVVRLPGGTSSGPDLRPLLAATGLDSDSFFARVSGVTAYRDAQEDLLDAVQGRELALLRAVCEYNAGQAWDRTRAAAEAELRARIARARGADGPPASAFVASMGVYAALGRTVPADDAAWRAEVEAIYARVQAGASVDDVVEAIRQAPPGSGVVEALAPE